MDSMLPPPQPQPEPQPEPTTTPKIDQMKLQMLMQQLRDNQNFSMALISGLAAALVGAAIWAAATYVTKYHLAVVAIGIGFLVGYVVRTTGQGVDKSFGVLGGVLSLVGCLAGSYLTACAIVADFEGVGFFEILGAADIDTVVDLMMRSFNLVDLVFYALAVYYGYKRSFRTMTAEELRSVIRK